MKRCWLWLLLSAISLGLGAQVPTTPNLNLNLPPTGYPNWGDLINTNFILLDNWSATKVGGPPGLPLGATQTAGHGNVFNGVAPINCSLYPSSMACLTAAQSSPATNAITIPPGSTLGPFLQYPFGVASVSCTPNLNGSDPAYGQLTLIPQSYGVGYVPGTSYNVTPSTLPPGAALGAITGVANAQGQITSYTISGANSGFTAIYSYPSNPYLVCPITFTVDPPPTPPMPAAVARLNDGPQAYHPNLNVDDFGCVGDGVADDRLCITNAAYYATSGGTRPGAIAFSGQKTYHIGSIGGFYLGGWDDGTVPVAAQATCTTGSGGNVTACTINATGCGAGPGYVTGPLGCVGYGLVNATFTPIGIKPLTNATVSAPLTACTQTNCPAGNYGSYVSGLTVSGGTGYPVSTTFQALIGPTCNNLTTPCQTMPPESPGQIFYGVQLYSGLTLYGNNATITGDFTATAANAMTYTDTEPYMAVFGAPAPYNNVTIFDLQVNNAMIGFGNLGSNAYIHGLTPSAACAIQTNQGVNNLLDGIGYQGTGTVGALLCIGGQWTVRAPSSGANASVGNYFNRAGQTTVQNVTLNGGQQASSCQWIQRQAAFDNWFNAKFFHAQDRAGYSPPYGTQACPFTGAVYAPPGGVQRMPDQDVSGQSYPDSLWNGVYGHTLAAIYPSWSFPDYYLTFKNAFLNNGPAAGIFFAGIAYQFRVDGFVNAGGTCDGVNNYGSNACPNPYEPNYSFQPMGEIGIAGTGGYSSVCNVFPAAPFVSPVYNPARRISTAVALAPAATWNLCGLQPYNAAGNNNLAYPAAGGTSGSSNYTSALAMAQPGTAINVGTDSVSSASGYSQFTTSGGGLQNYIWSQRGRGTPYAFSKGWYSFDLYNTGGSPITNAALRMPGILVRGGLMAGGQVTAISVSGGGTGYSPFVSVPCTVAPSTTLIPGRTTFFQADCIGNASYAGNVTTLWSAYTAAGYTAAPVVYVAPPGAATAQCTAASGTPTGCQILYGGQGITASTTVEATATCGATYTPVIAGGSVQSVGVSGGSGCPNSYIAYVGSNGGTQATATATINTIDADLPIEHFGGCAFVLPGSGTVPAFSSVTITAISCPGALFIGPGQARNDWLRVIGMGTTAVATINALTVTALVTAANTISITLANTTGTAVTYLPGAATQPWAVELESLNNQADLSISGTTGTPGAAVLLPGVLVNQGVVTALAAGTATVATAGACTVAAATCRYQLTNCGPAGTAIGVPSVGAIVVGTSFVINSISATNTVATGDTSKICWSIQ